MSGGYGRGPSFKRRIIETLCSKPYLTVLVIWLAVYIPLTVMIGTNFEEDRAEVTFSNENLFNSNDNLMEYYDNVTDTNLIIDVEAKDVKAVTSEGYIPIRLELKGVSKLYTNSPYDENRTWDLDDNQVEDIRTNGRNITWKLDVCKKETDAPFYKDRGETLIERHMIYRDVPTLNPPLINLFWILPALLGGTFLVFRSYFAIFALLSAFLLMRAYKEEGKFRSVAYGTLVLLNPLTIYSTIGAVQDDIIITFMFILSLVGTVIPIT